jgi:hypothetical protein
VSERLRVKRGAVSIVQPGIFQALIEGPEVLVSRIELDIV